MSERVDDAAPPKAVKPRRSSVTLMMKKLAREDISRAYYARYYERLDDAEELHGLAAELVERDYDQFRARAEIECAKLDISRAYTARFGVEPDPAPLAELAAELVEKRRATVPAKPGKRA